MPFSDDGTSLQTDEGLLPIFSPSSARFRSLIFIKTILKAYAVVYYPDWSIVVGEGTDLRGGTISYAPNTAGENSLAQLKNEIAFI
jgi:hypothetical protein